LVLATCERCFLLQLTGDEIAVPEMPLAVESATSKQHAVDSAAWLADFLQLSEGSTFREIHSAHGGSWAPALENLGLRPLDSGRADLVVDVHGLIHDYDLDGALGHRTSQVAAGGHLVLEFHHALELVRHRQFDTIRHGHPVYLSLTALKPALERRGLRMMAARPAPVYGGSLILIAAAAGEPDPTIGRLLAQERDAGLDCPQTLQGLQHELLDAMRSLHDWLLERRAAGRRVLGYGAPSKAPVLLNLAGVGPDLLAFTVDLSQAKQGRRLPVTGIPIRSPAELIAATPDDVLVFTWDIATEVIRYLNEHGMGPVEYYAPLPRPRRLTGWG